MARRPNPVPTYRLHKQSGQAICTVRRPDGSRKDVLLGRYNSPESLAEYQRLLDRLRVAVPVGRPEHDITVNEILLPFWEHARTHYVRPDGSQTSEVQEYKATVRVVRELYGTTPAAEFGPLALKAVRQRMVEAGWSRGVVNARVRRVKHIFKWAAAGELVPAAVYQSLVAVTGLQRGRSGVRDAEAVGPVEDWAVEATLPYLRPEVAAMVGVQRLTGMRPGEVCQLRPADIDRAGDVWVFRPHQHKTQWRGKPRAVAIGPRAQSILREYWPARPEVYVFSPALAVARQRAARSEKRVTPLYPSHARRNESRRVRRPARPQADHYTTASYGKAIRRAVESANREKKTPPDGAHGTNPPLVPHWHPNQLRHSHATEVRRRFGLEAAQAALGHSRADVTQVYAERDLSLAVRVAAELG